MIKRLVFIFVIMLFPVVSAVSDVHPKIDKLQEYADKFPLDPRIPLIMQSISAESMELNSLGYQLYADRNYTAAFEYFQQAVQADHSNSFAHYNSACAATLANRNVSITVNMLKFAVKLDWFWGLWLMIDPDLDSIRSTDYVELKNSLDELYMPYRQNIYITGRGEENNGDLLERIFHEDGTVSLINSSSMEQEEVARGYFCYFIEDTPYGGMMFRASLFEYYPEIGAYRLWYPNGHEDMPPIQNAVFYPRFFEP